MRRSDDMPLDPFEIAELEAIEAAIAGCEVDPEHAELAELSVLLATGQQHPSEAFTRELDARVARRFKEPSAQPRSKSWIWRPAIGAGLTAALAGVVVVLALHSGGSPGSTPSAAGPGVTRERVPTTSLGSKSAPGLTLTTPPRSSSSVAHAPATSFGAASGAVATPAPVPNGRRQIKSAQLTLATSGDRMDAVAQEVFNVTSRENGIVRSSQVTQGRQVGGGYATFNLGIPTSNLQDTLDQLSALQYAHVVSRTDATQDVNNRFISDQRRLADATALRNSLLKQLATAYTTAEIDSLKSQIHNAETSISRDEANLRSLQDQISYSSLTVEVNQSPIVLLPNRRAVSTGTGDLTLGQAAHDAGRVLVVAAGVILIGMAALVPIGLLVALVSWIGYSLRRRRRQQALDAS